MPRFRRRRAAVSASVIRKRTAGLSRAVATELEAAGRPAAPPRFYQQIQGVRFVGQPKIWFFNSPERTPILGARPSIPRDARQTIPSAFGDSFLWRRHCSRQEPCVKRNRNPHNLESTRFFRGCVVTRFFRDIFGAARKRRPPVSRAAARNRGRQPGSNPVADIGSDGLAVYRQRGLPQNALSHQSAVD